MRPFIKRPFKRPFALVALLALGGCGVYGIGANAPPQIRSVTVTAILNGQPLANTAVAESSGYDQTTATPTGVIATQQTNASGQTIFSVTPGNDYCWSYSAQGATGAGCQDPVNSSSITIGK